MFTWTPGPAAGVIDSSLYGSCIDTIVETIPDDGTATISHDRIRARDGFTNDSCSVTLTLARNDVGQVDPAFTEGGRVTATQIRATSVHQHAVATVSGALRRSAQRQMP